MPSSVSNTVSLLRLMQRSFDNLPDYHPLRQGLSQGQIKARWAVPAAGYAKGPTIMNALQRHQQEAFESLDWDNIERNLRRGRALQSKAVRKGMRQAWHWLSHPLGGSKDEDRRTRPDGACHGAV
jgi:hypothetical protein